MHELIIGAPPHFASPDENLQRVELYRRIIHEKVKVPAESLSFSARSLME